MYIDILRRLRDAGRRKRPGKWLFNSWFLFHDNAPAHLSILVKHFLAKYNMTTLEHPTYSPDLAATDLYLFLGMKAILKRARFCDAADIIKNAAEELKRFSRFQECLQKFTVAGRYCVFAHRDSFEGNVA